jgi:hypothetical protein
MIRESTRTRPTVRRERRLHLRPEPGSARASGRQPAAPTAIDTAVAGLAAWLETTRGPDGYGGPVVHWWQQCLLYTGAGLDWRYEGIIAGYLQLWERTGDEGWLERARQAGDDLVAGQLASGHFPASAFEANPSTGGTPHEAACDVGLLLLAGTLRRAGRGGWEAYATCAEWNLRRCAIELLWDAEARSFGDGRHRPSFVPNKAATICEALFLLAQISGDACWVERYALSTLDRILEHQAPSGGTLGGAIAQNSFGARQVEKYFPLYIARCVPALLQGYRWKGNEAYADAALRAMRFIARWTGADGSLPAVIYPGRRVNHYPAWLAPLGDVLRAADDLRPLGFDADFSATEERLLAGQDPSGGIQTATGFEAQTGGRRSGAPDLRDVLHVAGWGDKAFRYLSSRAGPVLPPGRCEPFRTACVFRGLELELSETGSVLEAVGQRRLVYRWRKGARWAEVATPPFWLR